MSLCVGKHWFIKFDDRIRKDKSRFIRNFMIVNVSNNVLILGDNFTVFVQNLSDFKNILFIYLIFLFFFVHLTFLIIDCAKKS